MKQLLGVLFLLILPLRAFALPSYYLEDNLFVSKPNQLTLGVPKEWGVRPAPNVGGAVAVFMRPKGRASIVVLVRPLAADKADPGQGQADSGSLSTNQRIEKALAVEIRGFTIVSSQERVLNGIPCYQIAGQGSAGERRYILLATVANERVYSLFVSSNKDVFGQVQKEFEDSLQFLKIEKIAEPGPG